MGDLIYYKLVNSITKEVVYVGRTTYSLRERLIGHFGSAKRGNSPIHIYIRGIKDFRSVIKIVRIPNKSGCHESTLIRRYGQKHKLYNVMSLYSQYDMLQMHKMRKVAFTKTKTPTLADVWKGGRRIATIVSDKVH